ncbi:MAG TPA: ABC transporter ATP-binding protein [Mycobacteriales bacterium]|jgi:ABC-type multidrug transport system, ATPase component
MASNRTDRTDQASQEVPAGQVRGSGQGVALEVRGLVVRRGGRQVLHGLDFAVPRGSVTGLLGPSGGGKTTVMRCVVGVQSHVTGVIRVLGRPAGSPELRHRIGYVSQSPSVYGDLSVRDNVRYFAAMRGMGASAADPVLTDVGLADRRDALVGHLSGGQRARVSLACALLGPPELLVLDEPTVGLDPVLRRDLWHLFGELAGQGTTLLVSSHVMDEASRCERLLLLRQGRLVADDTPQAIRRLTGTDDMDEAFLRLVEQVGAAPTAPPPAASVPPAAHGENR